MCDVRACSTASEWACSGSNPFYHQTWFHNFVFDQETPKQACMLEDVPSCITTQTWKMESGSSPWHSIWYIFWHSVCILSDISDILSGILCDILHSQLRSRSAHWDLEPRARGWGRSPRRGGRRRRWAACSLIKSKDPHLAGGTKWDRSVWYNIIYIYIL